MRRVHGVVGLAVVAGAVMGWAGLASAQSKPTKLPQILGVEVTQPGAPTNPPAPGPAAAPKGDGPTRPVVPITGATKVEPVIPASRIEKHDSAEAQETLPPAAEEPAPTGRQEPSVSMEWVGPPVAKVGRETDYTLTVRNTSAVRVQQVMVGVKVPPGVKVVATEPKALPEGNVLMWEIGGLQPRQEKNLLMRFVPDSRGSLDCQAYVTFTGSAAMKVRVSEPKLAIHAQTPENVLVGDPAVIVLTVSNPGDGPADQVKVHAVLSDGLEHAKGKNIDFEIGTINPGESRTVQLACTTKAGGKQTCEVTAEGGGDLKAQETANLNAVLPHLELEAIGPKLRYKERKAVYTFKVTNKGDGPASNVVVTDAIPPGFKYTSASDGGHYDFATRTASWFLGEVGAGQAREVKLEVVADSLGQYVHKAAVHGSRGVAADAEVMTQVAALSAIELEVADTDDPIEVGAETTYEVKIRNTGSKSESEIKLMCTIPDKMQFLGAQGPTPFHEQGKDILFDTLPKLSQKADAVYRVRVKATSAGDVRFKTQITSSGLVDPVVKMEATRIYED